MPQSDTISKDEYMKRWEEHIDELERLLLHIPENEERAEFRRTLRKLKTFVTHAAIEREKGR